VTRALLEALTIHARLEGCRSVLLGCGPGDVAMWRHLGFKPLGTLMAMDIRGRE
jgi:hypothetical protein